MVHRKGFITIALMQILCTLYSEKIHWDKCNLTHFSTNFEFADFCWMDPRATENAVVGHMSARGLKINDVKHIHENLILKTIANLKEIWLSICNMSTSWPLLWDTSTVNFPAFNWSLVNLYICHISLLCCVTCQATTPGKISSDRW